MKKRKERDPSSETESVTSDTNQSSGSRDFVLCAKDMADFQDTEYHSVRIGDHEVKPIVGLTVLKIKPLQDYFEGTKEKRESTRKKMKLNKKAFPVSELFCDKKEASTDNEEKKWTQTQSEKLVSKEEEETEIKLLHQKIYENEKMKQYSSERNFKKQRMAEEGCIKQLENLTETYFKVDKKRKSKKQVTNYDAFQNLSSIRREIVYNNIRIGVALISEKYWSDKPRSEIYSSTVLEYIKPDQLEEGVEEEDWDHNPSVSTTTDALAKAFCDKLVLSDGKGRAPAGSAIVFQYPITKKCDCMSASAADKINN